MELILASASPRRRELLGGIVSRFTAEAAACAERADASLAPGELAQALARQKAEDVFSRHPHAAVLGADTVVAFEGEVLGKPADAADAAATLSRLSGKTHRVYTGYCLLCGGRRAEGVCCTEVDFADLSDEFIRNYVQSGAPLDKAGSYGIQDTPSPVRAWRGSYTNVVGLPVDEIKTILTKFGINV